MQGKWRDADSRTDVLSRLYGCSEVEAKEKEVSESDKDHSFCLRGVNDAEVSYH